MVDKDINELWESGKEKEWKERLSKYYTMDSVQKNICLECELAEIHNQLSYIKNMNGEQFYQFLQNKYFVWKFTQANYCRANQNRLKSQDRNVLCGIKEKIFSIYEGKTVDDWALLRTVMEINGLAVAGGSGLLSILFPELFGTVDKFVVKALKSIEEYSKDSILISCKEDSCGINIKQGLHIESILRKKAKKLNKTFNTTDWTPRKIDMVLWTYRKLLTD